MIVETDNLREERTGLHSLQFIETRRHWFTGTVPHDTKGDLNLLNPIEVPEAIVESPDDAFSPFIVYYAESFIAPAASRVVHDSTNQTGATCATIKASRTILAVCKVHKNAPQSS